jgi:hypothetical protein
MLNSGENICALRDKKNKYSNSCVVGKKILNETKNQERDKINNPNTQIHDYSLSWLSTGSSIKSGRVKLILWVQTSSCT